MMQTRILLMGGRIWKTKDYHSIETHSGSARKFLEQALERSRYLPVLEGSTKRSIVDIVPEDCNLPAADMLAG
jgi:hypothetical protein